jgi:hypothetical protein
METTKKTNSGSQTVLNILLIIVCCSIFGLFIYDYVRKNDELSDYKKQEKMLAAEKDIQLKKIEGIANLYRETAYSNVPEGIVPSEESEKIKQQIAQNVSANLAPILNKVNKDQEITKTKLNKVQNELIKLLNDETKKSKSIRAELAKTLRAERARQDRLQKALTETQKVVCDLNGLTSELKAKYLAEHGDDSAFSDIGRTAAAPAKFVINAFTLDWFEGSDLKREKRKYDAIQHSIMEYYNAIGDPVAMRRLQVERTKREAEYRKALKAHKNKRRFIEIIK